MLLAAPDHKSMVRLAKVSLNEIRWWDVHSPKGSYINHFV